MLIIVSNTFIQHIYTAKVDVLLCPTVLFAVSCAHADQTDKHKKSTIVIWLSAFS